jgi:hypothetical protein
MSNTATTVALAQAEARAATTLFCTRPSFTNEQYAKLPHRRHIKTVQLYEDMPAFTRCPYCHLLDCICDEAFRTSIPVSVDDDTYSDN